LKTSWGTTWGLREPHGNTLGTGKKTPKILSPTPQKEKNTGPLISACM